MKYIFLLLLLNSSLFATNEIIIKTTTSEKISFELFGSDSVYSSEDSVVLKLRIHNYSDNNFFIIDPKAMDLVPAFDSESNRVFFHFGGSYLSDFNLYYRLKVFEPGDSLEVKLQIPIKNLKPTKKYFCYFVEVDVGYFKYDKRFEYLTKQQDDSPLVHFKDNKDEIDLSVSHKGIELSYMPIYIKLK